MNDELKEFCHFLANIYNGSSEIVAFNIDESPVDLETTKHYFQELKRLEICNPKSVKCLLGDIFYFNLTDKGINYLNYLRNSQVSDS